KLTSIDGATKLPWLLEGVQGSLETHMSRAELLGLARRMLEIEPGHLHGVVLGHAETTALRTPKKQAVLLPRAEAIRLARSGLFRAPRPGRAPPHASCAARDAALR